jgi:hypothetical protein
MHVCGGSLFHDARHVYVGSILMLYAEALVLYGLPVFLYSTVWNKGEFF